MGRAYIYKYLKDYLYIFLKKKKIIGGMIGDGDGNNIGF